MRRTVMLLSVAVMVVLGVIPLTDLGSSAQAQSNPPGCVITGAIDEITIDAGTVCELQGVVEASGSVIVRGTLRFANGATLRFVDIEERKFRGGGGEHPNPDVYAATDIGLWVVDDGTLDTSACRPVNGWNRTGTDPTWLATDTLVTSPVDFNDDIHHPYAMGSPVPRYGGPGSELVPSAEVLNLTRSCAIEGTTDGYAHIMINGHMPQTITNLRLQYLGVDTVLGRYPLHLHHLEDHGRGTLIENVVILNSNRHAYVTHASHGVTIRDSVALYIQDSAFWWDACDAAGGGDGAASDDTLWDHVYAGDISSSTTDAFRLAAFTLGCGTDPEASGNSVINSACSVVRGIKDSACFHWPATQGSKNTVWEPFTGNVAHNAVNGLFVWQNRNHPTVHHVSDFIAYANGRFGVNSGAYRQAYTFDQITAVGNGEAGLGLHSFSSNNELDEDPSLWDDWTIVGSPAVTVLPTITETRCCPIHLTGTFDDGYPLVIREDPYPDELRVILYEDGVQVYPNEGGVADTIAPSAPTGLIATAVTPTSVSLAWSPATDNVGIDHYEVRRNGVAIGTTTSTTTFLDIDVSRNLTLTYTVVAVDAAGNVSAPSNALVVTTPNVADTTPPSVPTNLVATLAGDDVALSWTASTDNVGVASYVIERDGADVATSTTTSYVDANRPAGATHRYVVYAKDAAGNRSTGSNIVTITIPATPDTQPPTAPTNLKATVAGDDVTLTWGASSDNIGVASYVVKRNGVDIATVTGLTYVDMDVAAGVTHTYTVHAKDAAGNQSAASTSVPVFIGDTTVPTVAIEAPTDGATVTGTVTVEVTATDNVAVASVAVKVDGVTIATLTTPPYEHEWDTTTSSDGAHTLTAVATDTAGKTATSAAVDVTVDNPEPTAQFTAVPTTVTIGQVVMFTDAHPGSHRRTITYGDGSSASARKPVFTKFYGAAGSYLVTLNTVDLETDLRADFTLTITVVAGITGTLSMR